MEGRADRQQDAALGARSPAIADRALDRCLGAADHHLPGRIVVGAGGRLAPVPSLQPRRSPRPPRDRAPSSAAMAPSPTGTACCMARPRRFSSRAVSAERQRAGRGQRRIFAERMPGDERDPVGKPHAALALEHPHHRQAHRHQRRLGVLGQGQVRLRPLEHEPASAAAPAPRRPPRTPSRAGAKASASARPMPTAWDPWPGKHEAGRHSDSPSAGPRRPKMARIETGAGRGVKAHRRPAQPRPTQPLPPQSARRRRGSPPRAGRCGSVKGPRLSRKPASKDLRS